MNYVLDACAMIAILNGEEGAGVVKELFEKAEAGEATVFMHAVNVLEVYYDRIRAINRESADAFLDKLNASPVAVIDTISTALIREAGRIKVAYNLPLGDCFAFAAASVTQSVFVTTDHSDFDKIEEQEQLSISLDTVKTAVLEAYSSCKPRRPPVSGAVK
jgi:predicted nucleic acid-binding protein